MTRLQQIAALLRWYDAMGVDAVVGDRPIDLTRVPAKTARPSSPGRAAPAAKARTGGAGRQPAATAAVPLGTRAALEDARKLADAAVGLDGLKAALERFEGCALKHTATNLVFADGNPAADIMIIGEAPGAHEDREGLPFVGPAGQLLDRMLAATGRDRRSVYITNILPWRPPGNRQPNSNEIAVCLPFAERHIVLKAPRLLIFAGGTSAKALLSTTEGITRLRGRWFDYTAAGRDTPIPAMPVYHPAFLLRQPAQKREAWRDLVQINKRLAQLAG